jgi:hypothetical protein
VVFDTLNRTDPAVIILQAQEATPVFFSQDRADLDGNVDAGGNPRGGFFLTNASQPLSLVGAKCVLWGRAGADTEVEVQVLEQRIEVSAVPRSSAHQPVTKPKPVPFQNRVFDRGNFNNKVTF